MAAYGCTNTSPLFVTGTGHADFAALVLVDGTRNDLPTLAWNGANAFLNGGGNFRAYADDTKAVRYPVEVVTFVTGASPDIEVWVKIPSLTSSESIYFEADDTETAQPVVGAAFGRDAVWPNYEAVFHLSEDPSGTAPQMLDSTGNSNDLTTTGLVSGDSVVGGVGKALSFGGSKNARNASANITLGAAKSIQIQAKPVSNASDYYFDMAGNEMAIVYAFQSSHFNIFNDGYPTGTASDTQVSAPVGSYYVLEYSTNGTDLQASLDGVQVVDVLASLSGVDTSTINVGNSNNSNNGANGEISEVKLAGFHTSEDWRATSSDNMTATATQWTVGAWELQGAVTTSATTGTAEPTQTEADVVTGGKTIILTLTGDTWAAAGTGPIGSTADTQAIIDGLDSAQVEATGWNAEVRDKEVTTAVVRTSNTVCTITLTASAAYDITATETITATIPAAVLVTSAIDVVSSPTWTVTAVGSSFQAAWARSANQVIQ